MELEVVLKDVIVSLHSKIDDEMFCDELKLSTPMAFQFITENLDILNEDGCIIISNPIGKEKQTMSLSKIH